MSAKRQYILIVCIVLAGLALSACVAQPDTTVPATHTPIAVPPTETSTPVPPSPTPLPPTVAPTPAPVAFTTLEDITGRWEDEDAYLVFGEDGTSAMGERGYSCAAEAWFDEGQLYLKHVRGPCCAADEQGIYEVRGVPGEYLILSRIDDQCRERGAIGGRWTSASSP